MTAPQDFFPWPKSVPIHLLPIGVRRYNIEKQDSWYIDSINMEAVEEIFIRPPARIRLWKKCFTRYKDLLDLDPRYPRSAFRMEKGRIRKLTFSPESHSFTYLEVSGNISRVSIELTYCDPINKDRDLTTQIYIPYKRV